MNRRRALVIVGIDVVGALCLGVIVRLLDLSESVTFASGAVFLAALVFISGPWIWSKEEGG